MNAAPKLTAFAAPRGGASAPSGGRAALTDLPRYVLITPARNEARLIEWTIESVLRQTLRPQRWIIASDGSTDGTDLIVERHARRHDWLRLLHLPDRAERHFAGKARAFMAAYQSLAELPFEIVGNLDADITLAEADHFEFLLRAFAAQPRLGVAGTPFREGRHQYDYRFSSIEHVSGACQLFRRECFAQIGGYRPMQGGGIDWVAVTTARMLGWQTRSFTERVCQHHRPIGTAGHATLQARWRQGRKDYMLGGHPLWQVLRCLYQMRARPYGIGGAAIGLGYAWAALSGAERGVDDALMRFHRAEQMHRLQRFAARPWQRSRETDARTGAR